ncbi:MAG: Gfo/Idh/MocA family oxidoreductase [Proteobacteria bacterium]|nr:Gfo/Idh/MocA family oxidoreductase [Pseudomonadota bacterium]
MMANSGSRALRALVIGAGPAAVDMHFPVLAALRDKRAIVLSVVCDLERERARQARARFGFLQDSGDALTEIARADIDVVYAFGSAQMHYELGLGALLGGKHLFVEKPVAPSHAQAAKLAQAARQGRLIAVGGHNRRFYKSLGAVQEHAGKAGWDFAEAVFHKPEYGKPAPFGARTWLTANGIHALDALVFMMGELPEHLTAFADDGIQPAVFSAMMRWRQGAQGVFLCNNAAGARREEYVFHRVGTTCTVTDHSVVTFRQNTPSPETLAVSSVGDGIEAEHESFLHAIVTGTQPRHAIEALAPSLFLAELIETGFQGKVQLPAPDSMQVRQTPQTGGHAVLIARPLGLQSALARWLPRHALLSLEDVRDSPGPLPQVRAAILGRGSPALSSEILNKLPALEVVGISGLSWSHFAPELLLARGVRLINASSAHAESVAEFALGLAILGRRRAFASHALMRMGEWGTHGRTLGLRGAIERSARAVRPFVAAIGLEAPLLRMWRAARRRSTSAVAPSMTRDLREATVGLLGWGDNARALASRLLAAGARVLVYTEHATEADICEAGVGIARASLNQVLAADIVSLHRGLTTETRHFLGARELAQLRPGSVLINVARAELIEPAALRERLRRGDVFACLDVFEEEPLPKNDPLRRLSNVFLTSHIAGGSVDMQSAAADEVVRKVAAHLEGDTRYSVSMQRLRTMT